MTSQFVWENFSNIKLKELLEKYSLTEVISAGKNQFEKQLLLKKWVFNNLPLGYNNSNQYKDALEVLNDKANAGGFNCTCYVLVYLQCATALGWYARKLGIDSDHKFGEEEKRHTVVEVWSNEFDKWFVIDPMFNAHFEENGIPLSAYEIRKAYLEKENSVNRVYGLYEDEKLPGNVKERHDIPSNYFWFFVLLRNNYLEDPNVYNSKALLWVDIINKDLTWYSGGVNKGEFKKHPMYQGAFIPVSDLEDMYQRIK